MKLAEELAQKWLWDVGHGQQWYEVFEGQVELNHEKLHRNVVLAINETIERCAQLADMVANLPTQNPGMYDIGRHETAQSLANAIRTLKGIL